MSDMGGLRTKMPITFWTFVLGSLALAGVPPLAGFWSKDELLVVTQEATPWLFVVLLLVAVMTAFYMTRAVFLTFFGEYRGTAHPHESPSSMTGPLVVLAAATVGVGFLGAPGGPFGKWVFLEHPEEIVFHPSVAALGIAAAVAGIAIGFLLYRDRRDRDPLRAMGPMWTVLEERYYIDAFYMRAIVRPVRDRLSGATNWVNQVVIDGIVNGTATVSRGFGTIVNWADRHLVDGFVNAAGETANASGGVLRLLQTGNVQWYAVGLFVGVIALTIFIVRIA
jgi:NADH-quinone oxidoreductase subunit L